MKYSNCNCIPNVYLYFVKQENGYLGLIGFNLFIIIDDITVECIFQPENNSTIHVLTKVHDIGLSPKQIPQSNLEKIEYIYSDSFKASMLVSNHKGGCYATLDHVYVPWMQFYYQLMKNLTETNSTDYSCVRYLRWFNESE